MGGAVSSRVLPATKVGLVLYKNSFCGAKSILRKTKIEWRVSRKTESKIISKRHPVFRTMHLKNAIARRNRTFPDPNVTLDQHVMVNLLRWAPGGIKNYFGRVFAMGGECPLNFVCLTIQLKIFQPI